jgi:nucleoid-associated protein YgaU
MASTAHGDAGTDGLVDLLARATAVAAVALVALLAVASVGELLRRRRRAPRLVATLDRVVPIAVRTAVVSILTLTTALVGARPAGGSDSVRGWLDGETATTTSTTAPVPTTTPATHPPAPSTTTTTLAGPTVLAPPVVLDPPVTRHDLEPAPPAPPTSTPRLAPRAAPEPPARLALPASPAGAGTTYVVVPGDCLWSIAQRRLGPGADARSIDAGWRALYAANRVAIGDDPNLIHPGLTLTLPPLLLRP